MGIVQRTGCRSRNRRMHNNIRDRNFLNLAYQYDCYLRIDGICEGTTGEPCHANWSDYGKGGAMKAHDIFTAPGCRSCHRELDQGKRFDKEEKRRIWEKAWRAYLVDLWRDRKIGVL